MHMTINENNRLAKTMEMSRKTGHLLQKRSILMEMS